MEDNKERNIDVLLRDVIGDDGFKDESEEVKYCLAVLFFLYQTKYMKEEGMTDDINEWLAQLELEPMNIDAALKHLRDVGILNKVNGFRVPMKEFSGLQAVLFGMAVNGKLEISLKNGDYAFKQTDKGREYVESLLKTKEGKEFWKELDDTHGRPN